MTEQPVKSITERSIAEMCGGRAAIVTAAVLENPELSVGARLTFAVLCAEAMGDGYYRLATNTVASRLGVSPRTARRWVGELVSERLAERRYWSRGTLRVIRDPNGRG